MTELAEKTDVYWSLPIESALQASIELVPESTSLDLNLRGIHDMDSDVEIRPIDIISSKMLVSQRIIELLQDESLLEQVPIAKGMPFQLFSTSDQPGAASAFSLFNHFWIKARCGTLFDLSEELLGIAVDLNWSHSRRPGTKLSHDQKQAYAIAQIARLKHLEERESAIRHSLEVLQKRFPHRSELVLWEINNQFANVIQYSPTYTRWKHHLQEALHGDEPPGHWLAGLIAQVDWQQLESCGLADTSEAKQLIQLINVDPNSMLAKMRVLLEKMIRYMFDNRFPGESTALVGMLQRLNDVKMFPSIVYAGLNYLRITGNIGAHSSGVPKQDAEAIVPIFLRFVEFFVDNVLSKDS